MTKPDITLWMPESDPHTLATMLKLIEEQGEMISRLARALMQGIDAIDPDTGRTNREEIKRESSDVHACMAQLEIRIPGTGPDDLRAASKFAGFDHWHNLIDAELSRKLASG